MQVTKRKIFKQKKRFSFRTLFVSIVCLVLVIAGYLYFALHSSLAMLDGEYSTPDISADVTILRDHQGVAELSAANRSDLAFGLGFLHAQERFFQMDLARRSAAGELSALIGEKALEYDKSVAIHQFRQRANTLSAQLPSAHKSLLKQYTLGVNQGLNQLQESPFEYLLLQESPRPWKDEDALLVVFSMYLTLQSKDGQREYLNGLIRDKAPTELVDVLLPKGTEWDSAIDNSSYAPSKPFPVQQIAALIDSVKNQASESDANQNKSTQSTAQQPVLPHQEEPAPVGSNNWAVSGLLSTHQAAMLAGDMHLGIRVPNTWFRAQLKYQTSNQTNNQTVSLYGLTLPGTPLMIAGSNTNIAWSFTNSYGDWADLIELELDESGEKYLTPQGYKAFSTQQKVLAIAGGNTTEYGFETTIWGPVVEHDKRKFAYRWVAHHPEAINLNLLKLEQTTDVEQALAIATKVSIPAQNFVVVDSLGNLGWTIAGPILEKNTEVARFPQKSSETSAQKLTRLETAKYPRIVNPEDNYLWTANARVASGTDYAKIGDGGLAFGARAKQIENNLNQVSIASENDLFKIQLDNKATFLSRWRKILLNNVEAKDELTKKALTHIENWSGSADKDDIGYWLVKRFRINVANALLNPIYQSFQQDIAEKPASFHRYTTQYEYLLWEIVKAQPNTFLPSENETWSGFFTSQLTKELKPLVNREKKLEDLRWGSHNTARIRHPLSSALPALSFWLDMPADELSGDRDMPFVQGRSFGASQRMVVSPGFEESAIMQMPGGQSGHPLSPFYRTGHQDWVSGKASPLMMQTVKHKLVLKAQ